MSPLVPSAPDQEGWVARALIMASVALGLVVAVVLVTVARDGDPAPAPTPTPTPTALPSPSPTPSPTPTIAAVDGALEVEQRSVSVSGNDVFPRGSDRDRAPEVDAGAVERFTASIKDWLDGHLDEVHRGGGIEEPLPFDEEGETALLAAISTDLADPSNPIERASYHVTVYVAGAPEWASAVAVVELADGDQRSATYVFAPGEAEPDLIAATPGGRA